MPNTALYSLAACIRTFPLPPAHFPAAKGIAGTESPLVPQLASCSTSTASQQMAASQQAEATVAEIILAKQTLAQCHGTSDRTCILILLLVCYIVAGEEKGQGASSVKRQGLQACTGRRSAL